ncbi:MAG: hypothetical protein WA902_03145, partial [Thermosynechococcaceae cyanobacterium]
SKAIKKPLFDKILQLPSEKILEMEDFVDFLLMRMSDQSLTCKAAKLSEASFAAVWDNLEDTGYDQL